MSLPWIACLRRQATSQAPRKDGGGVDRHVTRLWASLLAMTTNVRLRQSVRAHEAIQRLHVSSSRSWIATSVVCGLTPRKDDDLRPSHCQRLCERNAAIHVVTVHRLCER